jgi:sec-independent protein translocase protein TatC
MTALPLRPVGFDDRLTLVGHLSELRTRLVVCAATLAVLFGVCLWQSPALLRALDRPLASVPTAHSAQDVAFARSAAAFTALAHSANLTATDRRAVTAAASSLQSAAATRKPITTGLGEPFSTSMLVAFAFAFAFGSPILLWQLWAFAAPAVAPRERRAVRPLLALAPALFIAGVAFGYELVLPPAVRFLQGFNHQQFEAFVQAKDYYHFELLTLLAIGAIFEMPVILLILGHIGIVNAKLLRAKRRYAIVALAALAALLPGTDPVTTCLEMIPLFALYELSIGLLRLTERRTSSTTS